MEENQKKIASPLAAPIDFGAVWAAILKYKKLYYKTLAIAFVLALIISYSLPKMFAQWLLIFIPPKVTARLRRGGLVIFYY